jgi:DNA-binding Lrp family transcriptional regulator
MEAYVYLRVRPGAMSGVLSSLATRSGVRKAMSVVGDWDVMLQVEGSDMATMATTVLAQIHEIEGVLRTLTAPVVPPDRIGVVGWGTFQSPGIVRDACYVHVKAEAGAAAGLAERLSEIADVSGVAVLGGEFDLLVCVAQPWEVASGVILEHIQSLPGIVSTSTLITIDYEEPEEDRDRFSTWT